MCSCNEQVHAMQMSRLAKARHPGRARAVVAGLATLGGERLTLVYKSRSLWVRMLRQRKGCIYAAHDGAQYVSCSCMSTVGGCVTCTSSRQPTAR